jgi:hypothetical protein
MLKSQKFVNHPTQNARANPNIAVNHPYHIALGLSVSSAYVANLRIWSNVCTFDCPIQKTVISFYQNPRIDARKVANNLL